MLQKFARGEVKKQILPGPDRKSIIPKYNHNLLLSNQDDYFDDGKNYVNIGEEDEEYVEVIYLFVYTFF